MSWVLWCTIFLTLFNIFVLFAYPKKKSVRFTPSLPLYLSITHTQPAHTHTHSYALMHFTKGNKRENQKRKALRSLLTAMTDTTSLIKLEQIWSTYARVFRQADITACNSYLKVPEK